jgi:hypothetical protein
MSTLNGITFKKRILTTQYTPILEETFRQRYHPPPPPPPQIVSTPTDASESKPLAEQLADQVTPLYK